MNLKRLGQRGLTVREIIVFSQSMWSYLKLFFFETNEPFEIKLGWYVPWIVLFKMPVYVDWKMKMSNSTTAHTKLKGIVYKH